MMWYVYVFIAAAIMVVVTLAAGTKIFFSFSIVSDNYKKRSARKSCWAENEDDPRDVEMMPECIPWAEELLGARKWIKSHELSDHFVTSYDGLRLAAKYFAPEGETRGIVLLMHGFRSSALHDFSLAIKIYHDMGFGCFMPYHRAHGESEGKYITYGVKERYDVVSWCRYIEEKFPGTPVILDGISMGASTVMMALGLELPDNVKGAVADCGFTTPNDEFKYVMKEKIHLKPFPFLYTTALAARIFARFSFKKASTVDALRKNKLPLLIAHGERDSLVPHSMSVVNYEAAKDVCDAAFLSVPGAEHGLSFLTDRETYTTEVKKLIDKCIKPIGE